MKKKKKSKASKHSKALKKQKAAAIKREADSNKRVTEIKADKPKKDIIKMPLSDLLKIIGVFAAAAVMFFVGLWAFKAAERHSIMSQRNELSSAGIDRYMEADVNGVKHYIHVRGQNRNAPLLLVFPDYPGYLCASSDYLLGNELESYFTVVTWDMRGTGQTEVLNAKNGIDSGSDFTYKDIADDARGVCQYVRTELGRENDRFIVLGYSWGSAASAYFAGQYPGYVSAYIGVSQVIDFKKGVTSKLMKFAEVGLYDNAVEDFNKYVDVMKLINNEENVVTAEMFRKVIGMLDGGSKLAPSIYSIETSPFCDRKAVSAFKSAPDRTEAYIRSVCGRIESDFESDLSYFNYYLIFGGDDLITPASAAEEFGLDEEHLFIVENAGHELLFENSSETVGYIRDIIFGE